MKPFRVRGDWWLPGSPTRRVSGTLSYSPVFGLRLNVIGSLAQPGTDWLLPVVHGLTRDGPVTLADAALSGAFESSTQFVERGYSEQEWQPDLAFVGALLDDPESAVFQGAKVKYDYLAEWMGIGFVGVQYTVGEDHTLIRNADAGNLPPLEGEHRIDLSEATVTLRWGLAHSRGHRTVSISQEAFYVIEFRTPVRWETARSHYLWPLQQLLRFSTHKPTAPTRVILYRPSTEASQTAASGQQMLEVYYRTGHAPVTSKISRVGMLLRLDSLNQDAAQLILSWMRVFSQYRDPINIRLKELRDPYLEDEVLARVQAVEAYHRIHSGGATIVSPEEHKRTQARLMEHLGTDIPDDYKNRVQQVLQFANEPTLAHRLRQTLARLQGVILGLDSPPKDGIKQFIRNVADTRNYLTHYDPKGRGRSLPEGELDHLIRGLELIFDCCILQDLGLPDQSIRQLITGNRRLLYSVDDIRHLMVKKPPTS